MHATARSLQSGGETPKTLTAQDFQTLKGLQEALPIVVKAIGEIARMAQRIDVGMMSAPEPAIDAPPKPKPPATVHSHPGRQRRVKVSHTRRRYHMRQARVVYRMRVYGDGDRELAPPLDALRTHTKIVFKAVADHPGSTHRALTEVTRLPPRVVEGALYNLRTKGYVESVRR